MSISDRRLVQSQRAGSDTTQQQAGRDVFNITVNISQAESYLATSREAVIAREHSDVALEVARQRVIPYDAELVRVLSERGLLEAFADPAVQRLMTSSRIEAASTERDDDRHRLVELVAGRAQSQDREIRACISRAVAVVDDIDEAALRALTYDVGGGLLAAPYFGLNPTLDTWDAALAVLPESRPRGTRWYEHLDALGLIRHSTAGVQSYKPLRQWIGGWSTAFFATGLPDADAVEAFTECERIAPGVALPLINHELKPGFVRCMVTTRERLEGMLRDQGLPSEQVDGLTEVIATSFLTAGEDSGLDAAFQEAVAARPRVSAWAENRAQLPHPILTTDVGKAVVWAELQRLGATSLTLERVLSG